MARSSARSTVLDGDPQAAAIAFAQADPQGTPWDVAMQPSRSRESCVIPAFIGFAHLLRRDVFLELGGYRESFVFYGEEKDFCLRLIDAGYRTVYLPDALVVHAPDPGGRSKQRYLRYVTRNDCLHALYNEPLTRARVDGAGAAGRLFQDAPRAERQRSLGLGCGSPARSPPTPDRSCATAVPCRARRSDHWKRLRRTPEPYRSRLRLTMPKLLTIGHSYVVAGNRRLAHEMAVQGRGRWEVTAVAPAALAADLRDVALETDRRRSLRARAAATFGSAAMPHLRRYERRLRPLLSAAVGRRALLGGAVRRRVRAGRRRRAAHGSRRAGDVSEPRQALSVAVQPLRARVMQRAAGWIAFGQTVHDAQQPKAVYAARPSRIIPPGVDVQRFRFDADSRRADAGARCGWDDRCRSSAFSGRFVPEKGLATLMRALEAARAAVAGAVRRRRPDARRSDRVRGGASRPRARRRPASTHDDVPAYLNAMDLLCAPSQTTPRWREQFGRMLIEAMACGVPVVASRSGEIPHVVGDAGVLVAGARRRGVEPRRSTSCWARRNARRELVGARADAGARAVRAAGRRAGASGVLRGAAVMAR